MTWPADTNSSPKFFFTENDFTVFPGLDGSNGTPRFRSLSPAPSISMGITELPEGIESGMHGNEEQMVMVLEGSIELTIEGGHVGVLNKGDVWYIPAQVQHSARVLEGPARLLNVFIPAYSGDRHADGTLMRPDA